LKIYDKVRYNVYATKNHTRYPSTLYISVHHFLPPAPNSVVPVLRPSNIFEPQLISRQYTPSVATDDQVKGEEQKEGRGRMYNLLYLY
jgi:hypothetical protein